MYIISALILKILTKINTLFYKRKDIQLGESTSIYWKSKLYTKNGGKIQIGNSCNIGTRKKGYHAGMPFYTTLLVDRKNAILKIGNNCRLNGVYVHAQKFISIGNNCVIAAGVNIIDSNGHETNSLNRTIGRDQPDEIIMGNNVWVGLNAIILKGTYIGDNSIISAGSVVRGNFPPNSLITSNSKCIVRQIEIK